jgi:hypothetical protein
MATFVLVIIDGIVGLTVKINPKKIEITNAICIPTMLDFNAINIKFYRPL